MGSSLSLSAVDDLYMLYSDVAWLKPLTDVMAFLLRSDSFLFFIFLFFIVNNFTHIQCVLPAVARKIFKVINIF